MKLESPLASCLLVAISVSAANCALPAAVEDGEVAQHGESLYSFSPVMNEIYPFEIVAVHSNKCLDIDGAATAGAVIQQYTCTSGANQAWAFGVHGDRGFNAVKNFWSLNGIYYASWQLEQNSTANYTPLIFERWNQGTQLNSFDFLQQPDGTFEIRTEKSTSANPKCVDVDGASTSNYAAIQQYDCNGQTHQRFAVRPQRIQTAIKRWWNDLCVDVAQASTANYANVQQYECNDPETTPNQRWYLKDVDWAADGPYFSVEAAHSGKCLDVDGASLANKANVQQYTCSGLSHQKWAVDVYWWGSGEFVERGFRLRNKNSGKCLDIDNAGLANGTNIFQYTCQTQTAQTGETIPVDHQLFSFFEMN